MTGHISFFPVGNGDMTLVETESGCSILLDCNIRSAADNEGDDAPDVAKLLRDKLTRDGENRLFVDVMLLSHPDQDHCAGLRNHFHLGSPDTWSEDDDKILIRELWSSPMVFRRASRKDGFIFCEDAKAFRDEAKRRVLQFEEHGNNVSDGNRVLILGHDENGKTDDLDDVVVEVNSTFSQINGVEDESMVARLLGPMPKSDDDDEQASAKNQSSTILQFTLAADGDSSACLFLTAGDAEVGIWDRLWEHHEERKDWLEYDILQAPHHCSWRSMSRDSWSDKGENVQVSEAARNALAQARSGATIVASSKPIKDEDCDPPCIRAKREYESILDEVSGKFRCTGEHPSADKPGLLSLKFGKDGHQLATKVAASAAISTSGAIGHQPQPHG